MATYYKDTNANVFRDDGQHVTMGNADPSLDWNKLGLNVDHLSIGSPTSGNYVPSTPVSTTKNTGLTDLERQQRINNAQWSGQNQPKTPISNTNIDSEIVSDTGEIRSDNKKVGDDIKDMASNLGITSPVDGVSATVQQIIAGQQARQAELDKREAEDIASIEKSFATGKEELQMSQQEAYKRAIGEATYGGFLTRMETEDLQKLDRQNRIDMANFTAQKTSAIQQAQRAYADQDFTLAQSLLKNAQDIEEAQYRKQQDYAQNLMRVNAMSTPISRATEAVQDTIVDWMGKYPDAFK